MSQKRTGSQADTLWPRILKKIGNGVGAGAASSPSGTVPWGQVSKTGSSLAHLAARDHDLLLGLGDDDHAQYVHVSSARTISAQHNFAAGLTSPDGDTASQLGRAHVGYVGHVDWAGFSHRAMAGPGNYAVIQHRVGDTILNGAAGRTIYHRINNVDAMVMTASELTLHSLTSWRTNSFTSGFTGNGFRIDNGVLTPGKTTGEIDDLIVRGRMRVYELLVQQIRATNGSIFVSSTGKVKAVTGAGPYSVESETTHGFLPNDLIRAQRFTGNGVYQSNNQVTAVADLTHFTASLSSGDAPAAGMEFVRLGNTSDASRQNSLYMSADDQYNPFIDVIVGVNSFAAWGSPSTRRVRIGNLQGLFGIPEFGIFAGDGIGVANKYMRVSNVTQESHNIPSKMYDGSGNLFMQMDTSGLNFYVQQSGAFADATSLLFRRPDSTKILQLTGANNFGSHQGALWLQPGSADSVLSILSVAPAGAFSNIVLQNTVGGSSSQWIFKRLANGTIGADFPGYLSLGGSLGVGVGSPGYAVDVADRIRLRTGGSGTAGAWLTDAIGNQRAFVGLLSDDSDPEAGLWVNGNWRIWSNSTGTTVTGNLSVDGNFGNWSSPTYGTNWADYGGAYGGVRYRKLGDLVMLQGLANTTAAGGAVVATLPLGYRPALNRVFAVSSGLGLVRLDINSDGSITTPGTSFSSSGLFLSLNGVVFSTT